MGAETPDRLKRLLIVKMSSIGDIAHALPAVSLIKRHRPDVSIGWVVRARCASLLAGNPDLDHVYELPDRGSARDFLGAVRAIRADRYDTAMDMQGLAVSGLITFLSGARRRIGLDRNREANLLFLTEGTVPGKDKDRHAIDIQYGFAESVGVPVERGGIPVQRYLVDGDAAFAEAALKGLPAPVVVLNSGASTPQKRWNTANWIDVGTKLVASGVSVVLLGSAAEKPAVDEIERGIGAGPLVRNIAGQTNLRQAASVLARVDLVISGDTGPLHIAVDVGAMCIGIYGPTSPLASGPYGKRNMVFWKKMECAPCHRRPTCNGQVFCLRAISSGEVVNAALRMLGGYSHVRKAGG
ncbi:MAG: glycosyltransferase family 9 protein [Capsulimonadaceae bacterium]|nr:glycosyltransferase family 9 protein [Capsulimonadaceae bacterium]